MIFSFHADRQDGLDASAPVKVKVGVELPHQLAGRVAEEKFLADMLAINGVHRCALFAGTAATLFDILPFLFLALVLPRLGLCPAAEKNPRCLQ